MTVGKYPSFDAYQRALMKALDDYQKALMKAFDDTAVYQPGSYFVVRTHGFFALVIRLVTRSPYNHAGVVIDEKGTTIEAEAKGARYGSMTDYRNDKVLVSKRKLSWKQQDCIVDWAKRCLGKPYGWLDLVWLGLLQFGFRKSHWVAARVDRRDRLVCSQLVALCYLGAGIVLSDDQIMPLDVTPGDLAREIEEGE